jgi:hypothetical protein
MTDKVVEQDMAGWQPMTGTHENKPENDLEDCAT